MAYLRVGGHANSNTTAGYDRRDARAKRDAVNRLHIYIERRVVVEGQQAAQDDVLDTSISTVD